MRFQPARQLNAILQQEYFEPTISWALRVAITLNVPLLLIPLFWGKMTIEVIWLAFTGYLLSLLDFRGPHYQKVFVQLGESLLIIAAAVLGMNVSGHTWMAVLFMFLIGMFAALLRNWSDYGPSIGIAMGFFYLFGLSIPAGFHQSMHYALMMGMGSAWALLITVLSIPFQLSNPLKRSVALIWKRNTELLDAIIKENLSAGAGLSQITEQEVAVRTAINKSIELFKRRQGAQRKTSRNYDILIDLRKTSSLFGAAITSLHEEMEALSDPAFADIKSSVIYKTLSAFGQASARIAIVIFTGRPEDYSLARIRVHRGAIALSILKDSAGQLQLNEHQSQNLKHFLYALDNAYEYLDFAIRLLEEKRTLQGQARLEEYKLTFNNFLAGLNPYGWIVHLRTMFNINSQQFRYALRVAIAVSIGTFIFVYFHIDHGYWMPLTVIIVIQPYYGATLKKGMERIAGTVAGITVGGIISLLNLPQYVFMVLLIIVSFLLVYFIRNNYKVGVFFLTLMMVVLFHLSAQASWQLIGTRLIATLAGALLAIIAGYAFWPVWEKQRFPALMSVALQQNQKYLREVIRQLAAQKRSDNWLKLRNLAEAANSDVFACVQRMQEEPRHLRYSNETHFEIVGINFRITREINSAALAVSKLSEQEHAGLQDTYLAACEPVFEQLLAMIPDKADRQEPQADFRKALIALQQQLPHQNAYQFIRTELEKIVFELETMYLVLNGSKEGTQNP